MDIGSKSRRKALKAIGTGAVVGSTGLFGLSQFSEAASAQVSVEFADKTVELPEDDSIDDLRISGDISGTFDTDGDPAGVVYLFKTIDFGSFGTIEERVQRNPNQVEGSVEWESTHSLVEETDFTGNSGDTVRGSLDNDTTDYNVTAGCGIEVYADGFLVAESQDASTGTITFVNPSETTDEETDNNDGSDSNGTPEPQASVNGGFAFEVEK